MPNHITNLLRVSNIDFTNDKAAKSKSIDEFIEFVKSDELDFDLNKVIPIPKELDIECGSITDQAYALFDDKKAEYVLCFHKNLRGIEELRNLLRENPYVVKHAEIIQSNLAKYGHPDWYSWSIKNWGTKWNTYSGFSKKMRYNTVEYKFETAWSPPIPVIEVLTKKFPDLDFKLQYIDEGDNVVKRLYWFQGKLVEDDE